MAQIFGHSTINGGKFLNINGDYHHFSVPGSSGAPLFYICAQATNGCIPGIQALNSVISHGALPDSAVRYPPPRCLPGTCKKEKEIIMHWIEELDPCSSVFLIQGRTRAEKTAFMQNSYKQKIDNCMPASSSTEMWLDATTQTSYSRLLHTSLPQYMRMDRASDGGGSSTSDEICRHTVAKTHHHSFQTPPTTVFKSLSNTDYRQTWWMRREGISGCLSCAYFPSVRGFQCYNPVHCFWTPGTWRWVCAWCG